MMPELNISSSSDALPFMLEGDPITQKVVGVRGVAHLVGKIGCDTKMPIASLYHGVNCF